MASVSAPVTGRGLVVVVGTRDCEDQHLSVVAVDAKTGQPAWQRSVAAEYPCSYGSELRLAGDVVVAGGPDPDVIRPGNTCDNPVAARFPATGLDLATGRPRWHAPTTAGAVIAASAGIVIAAGTSPGCLVGLDPATGKIRWTVAPPVMPFGLGIAGNIAAGNGPHGRSEVAIGLDAGTGKTRWKTALPSSGEGAYPLAVGDAAVVATFEQGSDVTFTGLATATGRRLWQDSVQAHQTWTTIGPRIVVITRFKDLDRATIEARDPRTGVRRWQSGDIGGIGLPVTDGATIVTYSPRNARGFDAADGHQLWTVPGSYQGAAATSDGAYLAQPKPPKNQPQGD
jgi:outer membrane protein assembly factor BamB